ncbi:MAG TPA: CDP-alcohol phosphatidyltransferase family protein [Pseudonocardiaceae bacterium]|nr:CDP-alcohol phosphatidyltransferase family protein [Pseudonocardiaceae bacterium]
MSYRAVIEVDRVLTVPNALSLLRLAGAPLLLWLLLGPQQDLLAMLVLAVSGATDWLDGKLARWLEQSSKLGAVLDPAVDRLYTLATLAAFGLRDILPWWVVGVLVGRDMVLAACLPVLRRYGYGPFDVHYLGKAATFNLLSAFPLLLLAEAVTGTLGDVVRPLAYAFTAWGAALYVWSAVLYLVQFMAAVRGASPEDTLASQPGGRGT